MSDHHFGALPDGRPVRRLTLGRAPGPVLSLLDLGATVQGLEVTCGDGKRREVVLGQGSVEDYLASSDYLGGTIGRYANRIASGRFELDGRAVVVGAHDRGNSLHGGPDGFDRRLWQLDEHSDSHACLSLESPDGDQGFPGALHASVRYDVLADRVAITLEARTAAPTVVNLTNHAYFNLDGVGAGTIDDHELTVLADEYTPVDASGIPLGEHAPVAGTPFDLREPTLLGPVVRAGHEQLAAMKGLDHNFVLQGAGLRRAAVLTSRRTGTTLELHTDQPGLQVYTGNALDGSTPGASGGRYRQGDGIALEPQLFPDSPNRPAWPSPVLRRGEHYRATLEWRFGSVES
ncbi:MAG TPA: aldose epimerase family protein [Marmoricola sp.]|nr:aldose epimerase family protein [Marmoricola sp.]